MVLPGFEKTKYHKLMDNRTSKNQATTTFGEFCTENFPSVSHNMQLQQKLMGKNQESGGVLNQIQNSSTFQKSAVVTSTQRAKRSYGVKYNFLYRQHG